MIIKKPSLLLSTHTSIHSFTRSLPISSTSSSHLNIGAGRHRRPCPRARAGGSRPYATVAPDAPPLNLANLQWPEAAKGHSCPTPYQIFALAKDAPYSKQRFYELVKLYHPDRDSHEASSSPSHPCHLIPRTTKLERYRLIVAAHTILSDPAKRSAYDRFGAGWAGKADAATASNNYGHHGAAAPGPFSSSWRAHTDPDIWANATWEDWERFHARRDPTHPSHQQGQGPLYLQNTYFISLVLVMAAIGGSLNFNRADTAGVQFLEARDAMHDRASKELRRVRQETGSRAKEERIQWFLRNREAASSGLGVEEVRREKIRRLLPEQETCSSEDLTPPASEG